MWVTIYALALAAAVCFSAANLSRQLGQGEVMANGDIHAESNKHASAASGKLRDPVSQRELNDAV